MEPNQSQSSAGLGIFDLWRPSSSCPCVDASNGLICSHQLFSSVAWVGSHRSSLLLSHGLCFACGRTKPRLRPERIKVSTCNLVLRCTRLLFTTNLNPWQFQHKSPIKAYSQIRSAKAIHPMVVSVCLTGMQKMQPLPMPMPTFPVRSLTRTSPYRPHRHPQPTSQRQVARVSRQAPARRPAAYPFPRQERSGSNALLHTIAPTQVVSQLTRAPLWEPRML